MHRFYAPDIASTLQLPEDESRHCARVLRLEAGAEIEVVDGHGMLHHCSIALAHPKHTTVTILQSVPQPPHWGHEIQLCVAPTKNMDRLEAVADHVTELGISRITPILCSNSERRVLKRERLAKILVSAMKQSLQAKLPQLDELTPVLQVIQAPFEGQRFMAYCDPALPREQRKTLAQVYQPGQPVQLLIGPEGDFSPHEVEQAMQAGFVPVTLGQSRLRTETAAMVAVTACHTLDLHSQQH